MNYKVLYNPYADNGNGKENAEALQFVETDGDFEYIDITEITDYSQFFAETPLETGVVLCGGDGTLNRFVNDAKNIRLKHKLFYYPCGSGNDFAREINEPNRLIPLNDYIQNLPIVTVNGKNHRFINGIGFGIDGYCCETGDKLREKSPKKKISYTAIAVKGLLFRYKPVNAKVTVDGKTTYYKKVWLAPTMHGKYYGGGMIPTPDQKRNVFRGKVSVMIFHGSGKLKTLCIFPSIFKGEHVKKEKNVTVLSGNKITVEFESPRPLQIDGETIRNVTEYTVKTANILADEHRKRLG